VIVGVGVTVGVGVGVCVVMSTPVKSQGNNCVGVTDGVGAGGTTSGR